MDSDRFDVYVNDELAGENFSFRNRADSIGAVVFGSSVRDADLRVDSLAVYTTAE